MNVQTLVGFCLILAFGVLYLLTMILAQLTEIKTQIQNVAFHTERIPIDPEDKL